MSSTRDIRLGLVQALRTINAFQIVYEWAPERAVETPCAFVVSQGGSFQQVMGGAEMQREFYIYVLVASGAPQRDIEEYLDRFVGHTDDESIWKAIKDAGSLGGACSRAWVTGWDQYGTIQLDIGQSPATYAGVRFTVEVWE